MSAPRSGLNPEASAWGPQPSNPGANTQGANIQGAALLPPPQPESADPRLGAARGRRQRPQNDAGRDRAQARARGRGGQQSMQQSGQPAQQAIRQAALQDVQQNSQQTTQQPTTQQPGQPTGQRGRGGRGGPSRGGRGGRSTGLVVHHASSGSSIAPARTFGNQLSGAQPSGPEGHVPANGALPRGPRRRAGPATGNNNNNNRNRVIRRDGSVAGSENGSVASFGLPTRLPSSAPDLATRIHENIDSGNYDCPICLNAVTRGSKIWACAMCYHVAHYTCVAAWVKQALNQGLALEKIRCPACNSEAEAAASNDVSADGGFFGRRLCWCGKQKTAGVAPAALPPHSCGRICSRPRPDCHHTCPSACHAGPCPPCTETGPLITCFCGKETSIKACIEGSQRSWSCGAPCDHTLACRTHKCLRTCHADDCGVCAVPMPSICFCGKTQRDLACKDRAPAQRSADYGQVSVSSSGSGSSFEGVFQCETVCGRAFDCGVHYCAKPCHAQSARPEHCPTSPDVITHCLCGKTLLTDAGVHDERTSCQDMIPACDKVCGKSLVGCDHGHTCPDTCHAGPCAPCKQIVQASCACGQTSSDVLCSDRAARDDVQCETVCRAWLSCKQHRCNIVCCPGKPKAAARLAEKPRKRSAGTTQATEIEAEHTCLRPCGRLLKCGKHTCPQVCHKGACYSCVAYILDDLRCPCGQTVVEAPFLCGTTLPPCDADCPRPLPCGHPLISHQCHDDRQQPCPRCQRLVSKSCLCGKLVLSRVACGADNIQCSNVCGKTLKCQVHKCRLPCHVAGKCEDGAELDGGDGGGSSAVFCRQVCARPKPTCGHPCANRCHGAEDACSEDDPCGAAVEVTCPCQRQAKKVRCNVCTADPTPTYRRPSCDDECLRIQRNALLKDALRISDDYKDEHLVYSTAIMEYFLANRAFASAQEERIRHTFSSTTASPEEESGVAAPEKVCIFKPMKRHERQFLHLLAESFGLRSESRDDEPHRYVFLSRAPRTSFAAVPSISLAESEEIYLRLRDKAKAEAQEAAAILKEKEEVVAEVEAARRVRKRPFNAIFVPAALAATMGDSGVAGGGGGGGNNILDNDAFQTIVEAWQQRQQQHQRWAPPPHLAAAATNHAFGAAAAAAALHQHTLQPGDGDVVLRVLVPAAAPAVVEQLLVFLLSYMNEWWGNGRTDESTQGNSSSSSSSPGRLTLCHVDAKYNVLRLGTEENDNKDGNGHESGYSSDDQWNVVVAAAGSRTGSASASGAATTPVGGGGGGGGGGPSPGKLPQHEMRQSPSQPPLSTKRVVFKLRQKKTSSSDRGTTTTPEEERKRWMAILAQQPTDEPPNEEEEGDHEEGEGEGEEESAPGEKPGMPAGAGTEALRAALEQAFLREGDETAGIEA